MLLGIQLTENKDESYLVNEILVKLENHFGPSRMKTIEKLDNEFKLLNKMGEMKIKTQPRESLQGGNRMIESMNSSICKNNMLKKQRMNTHRKYESCPKGGAYRQIGRQERQKRNNKIRRRKSVENVCTYDMNVEMNKIEGKKKENMKLQKGKQKFYEKMEEVRKKIRRQKENIQKKPFETIFTGRKKMNKVKK